MFRTRREWHELILAAAILGSVWIYFTRVPVETASAADAQPRANFRAPALSLTALDGKTVSLGDLRGQVVLINFWATWCPPCRAEMPEIQSAHEKYHAQGLTVLAVNVAEDEPTAAQFVQQYHLTFPILLDRDTAASKRYRVAGLPTTFFVGREGVVRAVYLGQMNRTYIESQLTPLLVKQRHDGDGMQFATLPVTIR